MHHPSRKPSLYAFVCRFVSPPTLIFLGLWILFHTSWTILVYRGIDIKGWRAGIVPICCLTIPYQTQKLCVRRVDESLAVRNLVFSQKRCCRFKSSGMLRCVSGGCSSRRFEGSQRLHVLGLFDPEDEGAAIFETLELATDGYSRRLHY